MKSIAIALYENEAESDDELTFKKNDLFEILHRDYLDMKGWWLCKLIRTNKIGLAAGNRLKQIKDEKILKKINAMLSSADLVANLSASSIDSMLFNTSSSKSSSIISMSSTASSHSSNSSVLSGTSSSSSNSLISNNQKVRDTFIFLLFLSFFNSNYLILVK
jgi:hypothetical protein